MSKAVADYNGYQKMKKDEAFGRPDIPFAIDSPMLYAIAVRPGIHYTMGGGVHGANRLGGNSISETITFGRIAGEQATAYAKTRRC